MDRDQRIHKLKNGSDTAVWAANEIAALESHSANLATACAWAIGALPNSSVVAQSIARILTDYNDRNT